MMPQTGPLELISTLGTVAKIVLVILFLFSVVSWAIIIHKWRTFRACDREEQRFLKAYARAKDKDEMRPQARRFTESPSAVLFLAVMDRVAPEDDGLVRTPSKGTRGPVSPSEETPLDRRYLDRVVAYIVQDQISRLEAYLPFLATTGNITPFIGLLGTVMGIIDAFLQIGAQGSASIAVVAPGVAEALVATAAGLFTAIPAVIAYNYFLTRIRQTTFRVEAFSIEFLNSLQEGSRRVESRV